MDVRENKREEGIKKGRKEGRKEGRKVGIEEMKKKYVCSFVTLTSI